MGSPTHFTSRGSFVALGVLCAAGIFLARPASGQRRVIVMPAPVQAPASHVAPSMPVRSVQPAHVVAVAPGMHPVNHGNRQPTQTHPAARMNPDHRGNRNFTCSNGAGIPLINSVPAYGFTFQHLNSINGDLALKAAIDPATQVQLQEAARLNCGTIGTGGYFLTGVGGYGMPEKFDQQPEVESEPVSQQPQVIVVQVPTAPAAAQPAVQADVPQQQDTPLPDELLFVLVMRDGSRLEATAFTRSSDKIVYITAEGLRRTIALSDLDTDATIRVNGERGTQLQLSL